RREVPLAAAALPFYPARADRVLWRQEHLRCGLSDRRLRAALRALHGTPAAVLGAAQRRRVALPACPFVEGGACGLRAAGGAERAAASGRVPRRTGAGGATTAH